MAGSISDLDSGDSIYRLTEDAGFDSEGRFIMAMDDEGELHRTSSWR